MIGAYELDRVQNVDALELLRGLPDGCIDLIVTSPPYYNARPEYATYATYADYRSLLETVIHEAARVLKDGCFMAVNVSPVIVARASRQHQSRRIPIPFHVNELAEAAGFDFIDDIIWIKPEPSVPNRTAGFGQHRRPMAYKTNAVTEYILVYRKHSERLIDWNIHQHTSEQIEASRVLGEYETSNVWVIAPAHDERHPAIFPFEIPDRLIRYYSFQGDVVLDPFAGIGTTGRAAVQSGRRFIGSDISADYCRIANAELPFTLPMFTQVQA